ncbi:hypothetical protein Cgig2_007406 [Carnegiea gigantea]|uniref:Uncharacterized protein n=1 Tax=Carnegiea gigantea TaxID=171969 RepID=A0A9Q1KZU6_9CARY|nr:hypothetical protein Cgig2_007406 [Carnegiea gigantea]
MQRNVYDFAKLMNFGMPVTNVDTSVDRVSSKLHQGLSIFEMVGFMGCDADNELVFLCVCHVENVLVMHEVDCDLDVILNLLCHHHILIIAARLISVTGVTLLYLGMSIWFRSTPFRIYASINDNRDWSEAVKRSYVTGPFLLYQSSHDIQSRSVVNKKNYATSITMPMISGLPECDQ